MVLSHGKSQPSQTSPPLSSVPRLNLNSVPFKKFQKSLGAFAKLFESQSNPNLSVFIINFSNSPSLSLSLPKTLTPTLTLTQSRTKSKPANCAMTAVAPPAPGRELTSPPSDGISNLRFSNHSDHLLVSSWDKVHPHLSSPLPPPGSSSSIFSL